MRQIDSPAKFPVAFASGAGPSYVRAIPVGSQISITPGAASLTDGFVPLNFQAVSAGGIPPFGQDHNGILLQITSWLRCLTAGIPVMYDAAFQTAIGGYPANCWIRSTGNPAIVYQSSVDNNTTNPDAGGAGWSAATFAVQSGLEALIIDGRGDTNYGAGIRLWGPGGTPAKWLRAINGNFSIVNNAYSAEILTLTDAGALNTANTIQANAGNLQAPNGSISAGLDLGIGRNGYVAGGFSAGGNITAGARLRANFGAKGSGDPNAATILADYTLSAAASGYDIMANGFIVQWGTGGGTGDKDIVTFPIAFPNACLAITATEQGVIGWDSPFRCSVYGVQIIDNARFYWSCTEIRAASSGAAPNAMQRNGDFGKWIAVGW